uniref:Uncharacterized protein n=1 Tax=Rhizophora mucronata TaxID=61149 RepID=A0A2P2IU10_RHIMU
MKLHLLGPSRRAKLLRKRRFVGQKEKLLKNTILEKPRGLLLQCLQGRKRMKRMRM